jgi:hypothetical protein
MRIRHVATRTAVLVNRYVAKHRMIALHAAIDQPDSRAVHRRPDSGRAGRGPFQRILRPRHLRIPAQQSFGRTLGDDTAVEVDVIEIVNAAWIELPQPLQRAPRRHSRRRLQHDDGGIEPFQRSCPTNAEAFRARTFERSRGRRKSDHLAAHDRRTARVRLQAGTIDPQQLANSQTPHLAQALRVGPAQRSVDCAVDRAVELVRRQSRQARHLDGRQDLAEGRSAGPEQQAQ